MALLAKKNILKKNNKRITLCCLPRSVNEKQGAKTALIIYSELSAFQNLTALKRDLY